MQTVPARRPFTLRFTCSAAFLLAALAVAPDASAQTAPAAPTAPKKVYASPLAAKLDSLVIPRVEFEEATVAQVVTFLKKRSQELDPAKEGVNIMLVERSGATDKIADRIVTMNMTNVPLGELLRYVCMATSLQYRVDDYAVVISNKSPANAPMETKAYPLAPTTLDDKSAPAK